MKKQYEVFFPVGTSDHKVINWCFDHIDIDWYRIGWESVSWDVVQGIKLPNSGTYRVDVAQ